MSCFRIKYSKDGSARYISHLDLVRVFERALRRAGLPMAFSRGFNPHPKLSFAAPAPVGMASYEEYVDIELLEPVTIESVTSKLSAQLPSGLEVKEVRKLPDGKPALMSVVNRATYLASGRLSGFLSNEELMAAIGRFLALPEIMVKRDSGKNSEKMKNIRPGILAFSGKIKSKGTVDLEMELSTGSKINVRPMDVLKAFEQTSILPIDFESFLIYRTGIYTDHFPNL